MSKKKYNWIDDEVKIDFDLPEEIQELVDELEEYDLNGQLGDYVVFSDWLDVYAKRWIGDGLTRHQYDLLRWRYR